MSATTSSPLITGCDEANGERHHAESELKARCRRVRAFVGLSTLAFVLLGVAFAVITPVFHNPDEPAHVDMVRFREAHPWALPDPGLRLREATEAAVGMVGFPRGGPLEWEGRKLQRPRYPAFRSLPRGNDDASPGQGGCTALPWPPFETCQNYHYAHPPTYYQLMAPVALVFETRSFPTEVLALRITGVLLASTLVPATYLAARQLWPRSLARQLAAAGTVAMVGPVAAAGASVNNDCLLLAVSGLTIAAAACVLSQPSERAALALGMSTGAGLLTKAEFLAMAPAAALVVVVSAVPLRQKARCAAAFALPVILGSWWWLRQIIRYGSISPPGSEIVLPPRPGPWRQTSFFEYFLRNVGEVVSRAWGTYGWNAAGVSPMWRRGLSVGVVLLLVVWLASRSWRHRPQAARWWVLASFPSLLLLGVMYSSYVLFKTNGEIRGLSGRYLYPVAPILALALIGAMGTVASRLRERFPLRPGVVLVGGLATGAAILAFGSLRAAATGFYRTQSLGLLLARAETVAPVAQLDVVLLALGAAWLVVLGLLAISGISAVRHAE